MSLRNEQQPRQSTRWRGRRCPLVVCQCMWKPHFNPAFVLQVRIGIRQRSPYQPAVVEGNRVAVRF
eukprot:6523762-Alexandrium_andersonii.AAC.1